MDRREHSLDASEVVIRGPQPLHIRSAESVHQVVGQPGGAAFVAPRRAVEAPLVETGEHSAFVDWPPAGPGAHPAPGGPDATPDPPRDETAGGVPVARRARRSSRRPASGK